MSYKRYKEDTDTFPKRPKAPDVQIPHTSNEKLTNRFGMLDVGDADESIDIDIAASDFSAAIKAPSSETVEPVDDVVELKNEYSIYHLLLL